MKVITYCMANEEKAEIEYNDKKMAICSSCGEDDLTVLKYKHFKTVVPEMKRQLICKDRLNLASISFYINYIDCVGILDENPKTLEQLEIDHSTIEFKVSCSSCSKDDFDITSVWKQEILKYVYSISKVQLVDHFDELINDDLTTIHPNEEDHVLKGKELLEIKNGNLKDYYCGECNKKIDINFIKELINELTQYTEKGSGYWKCVTCKSILHREDDVK